MNQPIMLLAYVMLWTAFLVVGSVLFYHVVYAALTTLEILIDLFKENK